MRYVSIMNTIRLTENNYLWNSAPVKALLSELVKEQDVFRKAEIKQLIAQHIKEGK